MNLHEQEFVYNKNPYYPRIIRVKNVLCSDNKRRSFKVTREADTFFTLPGNVKVNGVTVSGFISKKYDSEEFTFTANKFGKNYSLLGEK